MWGWPMRTICSVQKHGRGCRLLLPARIRWHPTELSPRVCHTQWMPKQQGLHQWKVPWPVPWCLRGVRRVLSDPTQCRVPVPTWLRGRRLQCLSEDHNEWVQHVYISRAWFSNPIFIQSSFCNEHLCPEIFVDPLLYIREYLWNNLGIYTFVNIYND